MRSPDTFDLSDLGKWITHQQAQGRNVQPASSQLEIDGPVLRLQHDVDFSPNAALGMAKFENALDLKATYCFLVGSPWYDLARPETGKAIDRIVELGHTLGLHFDPRYYEHRRLAVPAGIRQDAQIFRALGWTPELVCCHRPRFLGLTHAQLSGELAGLGIPLPEREGEIYVSDSGGGFSDAAVAELKAPSPRLRLNLHPEWWGGQPRAQTLNMILAAEGDRLTRSLGEYDQIHQHPHAREQDARDARSGNPARRARAGAA